MKILITDQVKIKSNYYNEIFYLTQSNTELVQYFMKSHKRTRIVNKRILNSNGCNPLLLSLLKLSDREIFESIRIIEIIEKYHKADRMIDIDIKYNNLLLYFCRLENVNLKNINILKRQVPPKSIKKYIKYFFGWFLMLINSFLVKSTNDKNIFCIYNDKIAYEFAKPYKNDSLVYGCFSPTLNLKPQNYTLTSYVKYKFISPNILIIGLKNIYNNINYIKKLNIDSELKTIFIQNLFPLETQNMIYLSLKIKYTKLKNLLGLFDADSTIDYATQNLNKLGVKTICISHGINFKYKVNYISYGTNTYTFWSEKHRQSMKENILCLSTDEQLLLTGNIIYTKTLKSLQESKPSKKILVIGEYFASDTFYGSPFNAQSTKNFFDTLEKFLNSHSDCIITIRTRINDEYSLLAEKYVSKNFKLSTPSYSVIDEINESDLIISVFSNALHEALLLEKKVLQVNLLGIENYRSLAKNKLVYYADTEVILFQKLEDWYANNLFNLDYPKHLKEYCNGGSFSKIDLKSLS